VRLRFLYEVNNPGGEHRICRHQTVEQESAKKEICERVFVDEMDILLKVLKIKSALFIQALMVLKNCLSFFE
jgi:hypothetical protein